MSRRQQRLALLVVCLAAVVVQVNGLVLTVALPSLVRDLGASEDELQWIVNAYIVVLASLLLIGGSLGDRFGRARTLRVGLSMFGVGSVAASFSSSAIELVGCRVVMGIGAALSGPSSVAIIAEIFRDPADRGRALGAWASSVGLGQALGPVVGGLLLSQFWWGSIFLVNVPVVCGVVVLAARVLPESSDPDQARFDVCGAALSVLSVSALVWAAIGAPDAGWCSFQTVLTFAGAAALFGAFLAWERRCPSPMLRLEFFRRRRFSAAMGANAVAYFAFAGTSFLLTQLLQFVAGYSPLEAGGWLVPLAIANLVAAILGPRVAERVGPNRAVGLGLSILAAGLVALLSVGTGVAATPLVAALIAIGVGYGLTNAPSVDSVVGSVPPAKAGVATGSLHAARGVSQALGVAVMGSLLVSSYRRELAARFDLVALGPGATEEASASLGGALEAAARVGGSGGTRLREAAREAFVLGTRWALLVGVVLLIAGAVIAVWGLPGRTHQHIQQSEPIDLLVD